MVFTSAGVLLFGHLFASCSASFSTLSTEFVSKLLPLLGLKLWNGRFVPEFVGEACLH